MSSTGIGAGFAGPALRLAFQRHHRAPIPRDFLHLGPMGKALHARSPILGAVARLELTRHLYEFFPGLRNQELRLEASTVADLVREMEKIAPGFAFYVCDERGRLRQHVNIFVEGERVADRERLSDRVEADSHVLIMQALSGG
jgi:hypothetical protein